MENSSIARANEEEHVHKVYENIASHFSQTRYKPWPAVLAFLSSLPPYSVVIDAGCGNGKYLGIRSAFLSSPTKTIPPTHQSKVPAEPDSVDFTKPIITIGLDRSHSLLEIAQSGEGLPNSSSNRVHQNKDDGCDDGNGKRSKQFEAVRGDCADGLMGMWRRGVVDHAISIATIHHFTTHERRRQAIEELITLVTPAPVNSLDGESPSSPKTGRILIFVWALEQGQPPSSMGTEMESGNGTTAVGCGPQRQQRDSATRGNKRELLKAEFIVDSQLAGGSQDGEEDNNNGDGIQDVMVPWTMKPDTPAAAADKGQNKDRKRKKNTGKLKKGMSRNSTNDNNCKGDAGSDERLADPLTKRDGNSGGGVPDSNLQQAPQQQQQVFSRYYHLFKRGELAGLVREAAERSDMGFRNTVACHHHEERCFDNNIAPSTGTAEPPAEMEGDRYGKDTNAVLVEIVKEEWEKDNWWIEVWVKRGPRN